MRLNWRGTRCYRFFPFSKGKFLSFLSAEFRGEELKCCKRGNKAAFSRLKDAGENFMAKPPPFELRQQQRPQEPPRQRNVRKSQNGLSWVLKDHPTLCQGQGHLPPDLDMTFIFLTLLLLLFEVLGFRAWMEELIHHGKHQTRRGYVS